MSLGRPSRLRAPEPGHVSPYSAHAPLVLAVGGSEWQEYEARISALREEQRRGEVDHVFGRDAVRDRHAWTEVERIGGPRRTVP